MQPADSIGQGGLRPPGQKIFFLKAIAAQEHATLIAMYFDPQTKAPITLLELGLLARSGKLVVCCPTGFWRKGNVEIVCQRFRVPMVPSLQDLVAWIWRTIQA